MGRAPCCDKQNGLKKGPWNPEEDLKLTDYIEIHGPGNWSAVPKNAGLERCGKSCRLRWTNYLRPDIKRGRFSFEEEETIIQLHSALGNKWSAIAASLPGRTDNEIKNYWNTHVKKRLLRSGIDPVTHAPRLDFLDLSSILSSSTNLLNLSNLLNTQALLMNPETLRLASVILSLTKDQEKLDLFSQIVPVNAISNSQAQNSQTISSGYFTNFGIPNSTENRFAPVPSYIDQCSFNPEVTVSLENTANFNLPDSDHNLGSDSIMSIPLSGRIDPSSSSSAFMNNGTTEDERDSYCTDFLHFEIPEGLDISEFM